MNPGGTASILEILTVVANVIGIIAAWRMVDLTMARYRAVVRGGGTAAGPRVLAAGRHFRCELARIVYHVVTVGLVLWAFSLPDAGSAYGIAATWSRFIVSMVFTSASVMDLMSDSRLAGMLSDRPPGSKGPA